MPDAAVPPGCGYVRGAAILILTTATGGGHDSVALALREALHAADPAAGVRLLDPFATGRRARLLTPGRWYDAIVAYAPWLWGLCYHATNNRPAVRLGSALLAFLWMRRLRATIRAGRPTLVVAAHPLCARLASAALRTIPCTPPLHCVVTDLTTLHQCWACTAVDVFYVATPAARDALAAAGIARGRIALSGLPLRASFAQRPTATGAIGPARVLLLGGGCPSRRIARVARALVAARPPVRLIVVCGRNGRLRRRLARAVGADATVLGWCDDIAGLVRWSTVVITRGGPTTLAEALSQARPVLIYQRLPGQEPGNVALVTRAGWGRYLPAVDALVRAVGQRPAPPPVDDARGAICWGDAARQVALRLLRDGAGPSAEESTVSGRS